MNKEILISQIDKANFRIGRIDPAQARLGKVVGQLQYRSLTPDLKTQIGNVHQRKLAEEKEIYEAEKKKDPFRRNGFTPRTFDSTLNEVAGNIKNRSIPFLIRLRTNLHSEVSNLESQLPLGEQLKRLRLAKKKSLRAMERETGISFRQIKNAENGFRPVSERILLGYAGVLGLKPEKREALLSKIEKEKKERKRGFIKKRQTNNERLTTLRELREASGLSMDAFNAETGIDKSVISRYERGITGISEEVLIGWLKLKSFKIPSSFFPEWFLTPKTEGEYLRMMRIRAGISNAEFSRRTNRHHSSIKRTESGKRKPLSTTVKLYEEVLGTNIVFPVFSTGREIA